MSSGQVVVRDEKRLRSVPAFVVWTMPFCILAMLVCAILAVVSYVKFKEFNATVIVYAVVAFTLRFYGWFCDRFFNFEENLKFRLDDKLIIEYELNSDVIATSQRTVRVIANEVTDVMVAKKRLVLVGNFKVTNAIGKVFFKSKVSYLIGDTSEEDLNLILDYIRRTYDVR